MITRAIRTHALLRLIGLCIALMTICSVSLAEQLDSRWKWYYSTSTDSYYLDTQTIEYDTTYQIATVWTIDLNVEGQKRYGWKQKISYINKKITTVQDVFYGANKAYTHTTKSVWNHVSPDSEEEALANSVASILHINPIYQGGSDRWKWLHSTDSYGLYVAKDTLVYDSYFPAYSIWAKKVFLDGRSFKILYYMDLPTKLVWGNGPVAPPYPESDEEYVYNEVKSMLE